MSIKDYVERVLCFVSHFLNKTAIVKASSSNIWKEVLQGVW
jgi:hypothetical protein